MVLPGSAGARRRPGPFATPSQRHAASHAPAPRISRAHGAATASESTLRPGSATQTLTTAEHVDRSTTRAWTCVHLCAHHLESKVLGRRCRHNGVASAQASWADRAAQALPLVCVCVHTCLEQRLGSTRRLKFATASVEAHVPAALDPHRTASSMPGSLPTHKLSQTSPLAKRERHKHRCSRRHATAYHALRRLQCARCGTFHGASVIRRCPHAPRTRLTIALLAASRCRTPATAPQLLGSLNPSPPRLAGAASAAGSAGFSSSASSLRTPYGPCRGLSRLEAYGFRAMLLT